MRHYEIVLMIHPNQSTQYLQLVERYKKQITDAGGEVTRQEDWGRLNLQYPIKKQTKAYYVLVNFLCDVTTLAAMEEQLRYSEVMLRFFILQRASAPQGHTPLFVEKGKNANAREESNILRRRGMRLAHKDLLHIDHLHLDVLRGFITESGRMVPSRTSGLPARAQRAIAKHIKRARFLALLPYCDYHFG